MKSGANYVLLRKLDVDTTKVSKIIFTFKSMSATKTKEYPSEVTVNNGLFAIKLYQEDTVALKGDVSLEAQINYTDGAVAKTNIDKFRIDNSLATSIVTGNTPSGTTKEVKFEVVGDVIIGKIQGEIDPEEIEEAVEQYLEEHPVEPYDDTAIKSRITALENKTIPTKTSQLTNDSNFITNAYHDTTKQDVISDLTTIRSGAEKGATALQSVPSDYAKKTDIPSLNGYATEQWVNNKGYLTEHQSLDGKQDKLVSGTNIATINGNNLLNGGNITIQGGSGGTTDYSALSNKPSINNVELSGSKSLSDLGINNLSTSDVDTEIATYWNAHKSELKGADGKDGKDGADGKDGTSGVYVGTEEPDKTKYQIWINPSATDTAENGEEIPF